MALLSNLKISKNDLIKDIEKVDTLSSKEATRTLVSIDQELFMILSLKRKHKLDIIDYMNRQSELLTLRERVVKKI